MEKIKTPTGDTVYSKRLPNGLSCFVFPRKQFLRTYGMLSTNYGSIDLRFGVSGGDCVDVPAGIAHFLEHKLFEEEGGSVFSRYAEWGASVNAFTSYTQTSYLFSTTENWEDCLRLLIEFVNSPHLTDENVEKEKGIIIQELQMYADYPSHRIHSLLLENLYSEHPVRLDIGGTAESVQRTTVADLMRCYNTFYQPGNMALAVVGDVDPAQTLQMIEDNYPVWEQSTGPIERFDPPEPRQVKAARVEEELPVSRPRYLLGFKHEPVWQGEDLLRQQIVMSLGMRLIAGRSSASYERLYAEDLITDSFSAYFSADPRFAYSAMGSETRDPDALHHALSGIINELKTARVSSCDVERLKRQFYGAHLASYDSFEYTANRLISNYFRGIPSDSFLEVLQSVTADEVQAALAEHLDWERSTTVVIRPVNDHEQE